MSFGSDDVPKKNRQRGDDSVVAEQLRKAIVASKRSINSIGVDADIDTSIVQRFVTGEREPKIGALEKIAKAIGYRIKLIED